MTASLIYVFDRSGNLLDEIEAQVEREWLLNEYGEATWTMARTDPKCRAGLLRFGNRVMIQSNGDDDSGAYLPDWVGVIDTPRTWGDHDVTITAYSAEYLLTWRRGGMREMVITDTFGGIFRRIIQLANAPEDLGIREGDIWEGGAATERTIPLENLYDAVSGLIEDSGMEWGIEHAFDSAGRLYLIANWWERRGAASNFAFEEGKNIQFSTNPLTEQDTITNDVLAYSSNMVGWNNNLTIVKQDIDSIGLYGLRQSVLSVSTNGGGASTVISAAEAELKRRRHPVKTFDLTVMGAATLRELALGNSYPVKQVSSGFYTAYTLGVDARARITGMNWSDADQAMRLASEEVIA